MGYSPLCVGYSPSCVEYSPLCVGYSPLCVGYSSLYAGSVLCKIETCLDCCLQLFVPVCGWL